eukprot:TRINITY_DN7431_c0_g1_i1.p1 TRINITY_DN7431_c0_g1~~TRINITY_DN7431_c0_g1_i1.p1  ORF type:complete len:242 (-),score=59.82 TRINITY_DN7431_c0_g1_i1:240-965(-)
MSRTCLIVGVNGTLGKAIRTAFQRASFRVVGIDTHESTKVMHQTPRAEEKDFVPYKGGSDFPASAKDVVARIAEIAPAIDAVICTAGGWRGGSISEPVIFQNVEAMHDMNVRSALLASHIAASHLKSQGLLVLTGAEAALRPTPSMLAYGMSKAATHHLIASLAKDNTFPEKSVVVGILPTTLDTPINRAVMPGADFLSWTPVSVVADKILSWAERKEVPNTGDLYSIITNQGTTSWKKVE